MDELYRNSTIPFWNVPHWKCLLFKRETEWTTLESRASLNVKTCLISSFVSMASNFSAGALSKMLILHCHSDSYESPVYSRV